ncbi:MAG TPA: FkbM family methyltransferase, partial [Actinomycetota bacterium]|nr:FkbM family methyltransferase [Actinomycetota bacterium]
VPFTIAGPGDDRGVIGEIRRSGNQYEPGVMRAISRVLGRSSVSFDIGANIGVFAVLMARLSPRGTVYAFEPAAESYGYLVGNLTRNSSGNFVAERAAAFRETGTVSFVFSPSYPAGSFVGESVTPDGELRTVPAIAVDEYVERKGIARVDLIMIDAEGAEVSVLIGARRTLARHRPVLLAEINPALLQRLGHTSYRELAGLLRSHHDLCAMDGEGEPTLLLSDDHLDLLLRREGVIDALCLPKPKGAGRAARRRGERQLAELRAEFEGAAAPASCFLVEPAFSLGVPAEAVAGPPSAQVVLTVPVTNTSRYWFSSDSLYYPVHLSYRWYGGDGRRVEGVAAHRGRFEPALAPGASATVTVPVLLPPAPGSYELSLTLVQENYAWFDELDPALQLRVPVTVAG